MKKMKKIISALLLSTVLLNVSASALVIPNSFSWAKTEVEYCISKGIIKGDGNGNLMLDKNLTREQMAKILTEATGTVIHTALPKSFTDIDTTRWSYRYIESFKKYMVISGNKFNPTENVTREEFIASFMKTLGLTDQSVQNINYIAQNFSDGNDINLSLYKLLTVACEKGFIKGSNNKLNPKGLITRAEACVLLHRVLESPQTAIQLSTGFKIVSPSTVSLEQAKAWARSRGAAQIYIDIADTYWKYGEITGINPEMMYAQAGKETAYGKYTGIVKPEMNNWAGIKTKDATGDEIYDHETFATPDDGVRAHFNHITAYVGLPPVGTPHGRYFVVKGLSWAGTVKYVEELGGRWAPNKNYGYDVYNLVLEMRKF